MTRAFIKCSRVSNFEQTPALYGQRLRRQGGVVTEGGNGGLRSVPELRRRGPALGLPIQDRKRGTAPARACVHVDPSRSRERAHHQRQSRGGPAIGWAS